MTQQAPQNNPSKIKSKQRIVIGDKEYSSIEEMPEAAQKVFKMIQKFTGVDLSKELQNTQASTNSTTTITGDGSTQTHTIKTASTSSNTVITRSESGTALHPESTNPLHTNKAGDFTRTLLMIAAVIAIIIFVVTKIS